MAGTRPERQTSLSWQGHNGPHADARKLQGMEESSIAKPVMNPPPPPPPCMGCCESIASQQGVQEGCSRGGPGGGGGGGGLMGLPLSCIAFWELHPKGYKQAVKLDPVVAHYP